MHAVLFDIDGTLLHSAEVDDALYRRAVAEVLGEVHLRPSLHDYDYVTDTGILGQIAVDNDIDPARARVDAVRSRFVDLLREHIDAHGPFVEIPGARRLLQELAASPAHTVAIATGGWRESAILKLESAGIDWSEFPLATANDHHERTSIMSIALASLGDGFDSVTYYGDGPWDREACARLGWRFVAVGTELDGLESYIGHEPVFREIRVLTTDDIDAIFRVRTSVTDNHLSEEQLRQLGITRDGVTAMLREGALRGWCAESEGDVVGFSLATIATREINALFVLDHASGRGLGQALLDIAVYHLRRLEPGTVRLRTDPSLPAYRFYRKRGWKDTGERHPASDDVFLELE